VSKCRTNLSDGTRVSFTGFLIRLFRLNEELPHKEKLTDQDIQAQIAISFPTRAPGEKDYNPSSFNIRQFRMRYNAGHLPAQLTARAKNPARSALNEKDPSLKMPRPALHSYRYVHTVHPESQDPIVIRIGSYMKIMGYFYYTDFPQALPREFHDKDNNYRGSFRRFLQKQDEEQLNTQLKLNLEDARARELNLNSRSSPSLPITSEADLLPDETGLPPISENRTYHND
jgi:hypothetical protein